MACEPCDVPAQIQLLPIVAEAGEAVVVAGATALGMYGLHAILTNAGTHTIMQRDATSTVAPQPAMVQSAKSTNKILPDHTAGGDHSTIKLDKTGKVVGTATYTKNPKNPSGFDQKKRVDIEGGDHYDKTTGQRIPTPHVHEGDNTRPAEPSDLPQPKSPTPKPQTPQT